MIEPNRLSVPGEAAARERVEAVFARVDRLTTDDLSIAPVPSHDREDRGVLLAELEATADRVGRGALLDDARERVRDALVARAADPFVARSAVGRVRPSGRPEDIVAVVAAIEDAVAVAVVEDQLAPAVAHDLAEPGRRLLGLPPAGLPAIDADPAGDPPWAPSAADWAAASRGTPARRGEPLPGVRGLWLLFVGIMGISGAVAALAWGMTEGSPWHGALATLAVVAACWTLATWRRPG